MIEIVCEQTGDSAEAETPEAAYLAGRTLIEDSGDPDATVLMIVDGAMAARGVTADACRRGVFE